MKGSITRRRTRARRSSRGFTLIELMVVVLLIAMLAALAAPSMTRARNDRLTFSYARQASEMVHNARARAAGRGAAQLVVYTKALGTRGALLVYEAHDGLTAASSPVEGPNPVSSCRNARQWDNVPALTATTTQRWTLVEGLNLNASEAGAIQNTENIIMDGLAGTAVATPTAVVAWALCTTPNGTTYFGSGADAQAAIGQMQLLPPFTGVAEVDVARHVPAGTAIVGLNRRVVISAGGAPRVKSE